ncbi:MAG: hypothetical protein GX444_14565, partial [Myxococcales bacterium]|nr:hypothetical protein [Myxococcales bacterium]
MKTSSCKMSFLVLTFFFGLFCSKLFAGSLSMYYNDDYGSSITCPGYLTIDSYNTLYTYDDEMAEHGHDINYTLHNPSFYHNIVTDPDLVSYGLDYYFAEIDDFVFVTGHGTKCTDDYGVKQSCLRVINSFNGMDGQNTCKIYPRLEMVLGENEGDDIEFLHLTNCNSMSGDDNRWSNTWRPVFHGIHEILGFHGLGAEGSSLIDLFKNFAHDAQSSPVAMEWVDNLWYDDYWAELECNEDETVCMWVYQDLC